jgi:exodeoxyribonuclease-1
MLVDMSKGATFFFYDLETTGFDPKVARIMQFAGQRTDMDLNPVGEPVNVLIKLTPDVLPDPDAILVTGITPQQTLIDGVTEAEFLQQFYEEIRTDNTTFVGFNSIRFDDEFMRYLLYRNFYDAYEWQWDKGCSRWDMLDVVRMCRALRPEGIEWPFASDGKPSNRLELLTSVNKLNHDKAHDALSDVYATIAVAKLIKEKQPELFNYLYEQRTKQTVKKVIQSGEPFIYTSGRYPSSYLHTTAAVLLAPHPEQDAGLVYNLRVDPTPFADKTPAELADHWRFSKDPEHVPLPIKTLKYNRCPAVAPLGVLNEDSQKRLELPLETVKENLAKLRACRDTLLPKVIEAIHILDAERTKAQGTLIPDEAEVDSRLYDGFFDAKAKTDMSMVRAADPAELGGLELHEERLQQLLPLYKARNYPGQLTAEERTNWDAFCRRRLQDGGTSSRLAKYMNRLQALAENASDAQRYLLEELQLYAESVIQLEEA